MLPSRVHRQGDDSTLLKQRLFTLVWSLLHSGEFRDVLAYRGAEDRFALVEPEIQGDPPVPCEVWEGEVQRVAIADDHIARLADHGYCARQVIAVLLHERRDVQVTPTMRTRNHPYAIPGRAAVQLAHEVEPVQALLRTLRDSVPVRGAVLMPRDPRTQLGGLNLQAVCERSEALSVDRGCQGQELWVTK